MLLQRGVQGKYFPDRRLREMNKGSGVSSAAASNSGAEGSELLSSMLAAAPPQQQKRILGERLYPLVNQHKVLFPFNYSLYFPDDIIYLAPTLPGGWIVGGSGSLWNRVVILDHLSKIRALILIDSASLAKTHLIKN